MSFLGISFDSDDDSKNKKKSSIPVNNDPQPQQQQVPSFAMPNQPAYQSQPGYTPGPQMSYQPQPQLSDADRDKWQGFVNNLYQQACNDNPLFGDFIKQADAMTGIITNEGQRIAAVGALMKQKGIAKSQIIDACNAVAKALDDGRTAFMNDQAGRTQKGIGDVQQQIANKQQQIAQLNQEIAQLNGSMIETQNNLAAREYGFNFYHQQMAGNVIQQIKNLTSFIND